VAQQIQSDKLTTQRRMGYCLRQGKALFKKSFVADLTNSSAWYWCLQIPHLLQRYRESVV